MPYTPSASESTANIEYEPVELSGEGATWDLSTFWMPTVSTGHPTYTDILAPFDKAKFVEPRLPIDIGPIETAAIATCPRVLRVTIKPVGTTQIRLPGELLPVRSLVERLLSYEAVINPNLTDFEIHLTLDHAEVPKGTSQRFPGWHTDGFQGAKFPEKLVCEHSYVVSSAPGFEMCLQPFFIEHLDEAIYNMFKVFDQQARSENVYSALPNHVYLIDPYMVHRTPIVTSALSRVFMRLTVANKELPIEYNTLNPMWDQRRHPPKLDIRDILVAPDVPICWEQYGLGAAVDKVVAPKTKLHQARNEFVSTHLSVGEELEVPDMLFPIVRPSSQTYRDITQPFDTKKYTRARLPIDLGPANPLAIASCPNVLRLLVKQAGTTSLQVPKELSPIRDLLLRLCIYDRNINPLYEEMYAHITIDSRTIDDGVTQRYPGFHGDDLQGGIFTDKVIVAHSYILATAPTTEVCVQPFFVDHLIDTFESVFDAFDQQARECNIYPLRAAHVYLTDPYSVHRSPLIAEPTERTFFRLTVSPAEMLLPHNSINPMFDESEYPGHSTHHLNETRFLVTPDRPVPLTYYGLADSAVATEQ